ncbi:response regulator transcription factor [Vallitalea guaymasensis]|uniref:response regulator transcription factor n=1 Tax=Vallitalea guaymasensis TaxID=1185412 RepID=UPI00235656B0|nr:response regulator [Vallitalea guaymasensis]
MYKLLLVDDESIVRESISKLINWEKYNISLIGSCSNAIEAIDIAKKNEIDIIITDIKMPVMNGIELIKNVKGLGIDCEFIILSGYNEFEFAKNAMQENVKHYILKPCSEKEIEEALLKTISDINSKRMIEKKMEAQQFVQHIFLQQFINLVLQNKEPDLEMEHWLNILFSDYDKLFWVSFNWDEDVNNPEGVYDSFLEFAESTSSTVISSVMKINNTLGCFYFSTKDELPYNELTFLQKRLLEQLGSMPVLNKVIKCSPNELCGIITKIYKKSSYYLIINRDGISRCDIKGAYNDVDIAHIHEQFVKYITQGDKSSIKDHIKSLFYKYDRNFSVMVCTKLLIKYSSAGLLDTKHLTSVLNQVYAIDDTDEVIVILNNIICSLIVENKDENFVDKITKYIDEHLDDSNLTLKWCAKELVFLNEDYISRAFTKQVGQNFTSYLNHKRIERAKNLISLMSEDEKIYTVAEKIGLGHNPQYFSKIFKKSTGYTPKEYKELYN